MSYLKIVFFGSFQAFSPVVLEQLLLDKNLQVCAVVTTPPHPDKRGKDAQPNPTHILALKKNIPLVMPAVLDNKAAAELNAFCPQPDYFVTAGYGKLLPPAWLSIPKLGALNVHFSLLPKYRGANPAEWALLMDESETGVSIIQMSSKFDTGELIAQSLEPITPTDTRQSLYEKLYLLGGLMAPAAIAAHATWKESGKTGASETQLRAHPANIKLFLPPQTQSSTATPYARRLQKKDGFIAWSNLEKVRLGETLDWSVLSPTLQALSQFQPFVTSNFIVTATRALGGFPDIWTIIPTTKGDKRMKILSAATEGTSLQLQKVQIEGKSPAEWNQVKNILLK